MSIRYVTLLNYVCLILKIATFTASTLIVIRKLQPKEFAIWGLINALTSMFISVMSLWQYWTARSIRRGHIEAYTSGLLLTLGWMILSTLIYLAVSSGYTTIFGPETYYYLIISIPFILISEIFTYHYNLAISSAPHYVGYSDLTLGVTRLIATYLLLVHVQKGYVGAIYSYTIGLFTGLAVLSAGLIKEKIKITKFDKTFIFAWIKGAPVPLLRTMTAFLRNLDRAMLPILAGNELPLAYLSAGYVARLPLQSGPNITAGLYSKALREKKGIYVEETLKLLLFLTTFIYVTITSLSHNIMYILRPEYVKAHTIFIAVASLAYIEMIYRVFYVTIQATDPIDTKVNFRFRELLTSNLFKYTALNLIRALLSILSAILIIVITNNKDYVFIALAFPASWSIITLAITPLMYKKAKQIVGFRIPWKDLTSFAVSGIAILVYYGAINNLGSCSASFWPSVFWVSLHSLIGAAIYYTLTGLLSTWTRNIYKNVIRRLKAII